MALLLGCFPLRLATVAAEAEGAPEPLENRDPYISIEFESQRDEFEKHYKVVGD